MTIFEFYENYEGKFYFLIAFYNKLGFFKLHCMLLSVYNFKLEKILFVNVAKKLIDGNL